jgi:hypothetical protein
VASEVRKQSKTVIRAERSRIFNCTVCTLVQGVPAGVNVSVHATSEQAARTRAGEILDHLLEGTTVLKPGDFDLIDGERVRLYLDGGLMSADCDVDPEIECDDADA